MHVASANENDQAVVAPARYQPLVVLLVAFGGGIVLDRYWPCEVAVWWSGALSAWMLWSLLWWFRHDRISTLFLLIAVAAAGASWHHTRWHLFDTDELALVAREELQPMCVEAIAISGPRRIPAPPINPMRTIPRGDQTQLEVRVVRVRDRDQWKNVSGKSALRVDGHLLNIQAGDRLRVFAALGRATPPRNPGEYDFSRLQRTRRKLCQLLGGYPDCVSVIGQGTPWSFRRLLSNIRDRGNALLKRHIGPDRAALASAILLGSREQLDPDRTEAFFLTGSIHLLAISGLHVGILAGALLLAGRFGLIPQRWALWGTILFVVMYALLTDARLPVVRATVLIVVMCLAQLMGRRSLAFNSMAVAGFILLAFSPAQLFQVGTHLSFLAVATLIASRRWFKRRDEVDPLDRLIAQSRPIRNRVLQPIGKSLGGMLAFSTLIWLVAMPLVMYRFHLVSPGAVALNPIIWIPIAVALYAGFGVLLFGWLFPPLAELCGWVCDGSLAVIEACVQSTRDTPGSYFMTPGPTGWWVLGFYAALACWLSFPRWRPPRRWAVALMAAWIAVGFFSAKAPAQWNQNEQPLHCTFIAIGNGTSVVLELPDGRTLLYDAGRLGSTTVGARSISGFLWSRGITHLDALVISHADADHYNAIPELLELIDVEVVYVSPVMFDDSTRALDLLKQTIQSSGVPIRHLYAGDRLAKDSSVHLEVLHPPKKGILGSDNANSIVLQIDYAGRRILLPGDLETPGMEGVLAEDPLDCDVVMAPHHGSARSNPVGFSAWSTPEWVVVSGGYGRDLTPIRNAYEAGGAQVLHTAAVGAVRVTVESSGKLGVRSWRYEGW